MKITKQEAQLLAEMRKYKELCLKGDVRDLPDAIKILQAAVLAYLQGTPDPVVDPTDLN